MIELFNCPEKVKKISMFTAIRAYFSNEETIPQLGFNGDIAAFLNADIDDFYSLLKSGNLLWLTENMLAYTDTFLSRRLELFLKARFPDSQGPTFRFMFGPDSFQVFCLSEPDEIADTPFFDMLLESQRRRKIGLLVAEAPERNSSLMFSSGAFDLFLAENKKLSALVLKT
jgi:hypothetical protein